MRHLSCVFFWTIVLVILVWIRGADSVTVCSSSSLASGLIAKWTFNLNNCEAVDYAGVQATGSLVNGPTCVLETEARYGNAIKFGAGSDYVSIPDSASLRMATSSFTVSLWVNMSRADINQRFLSKGSFGCSTGWMIRTDSGSGSHVPMVELSSSNSCVAQVIATGADAQIPVGVWKHVVVSVDRLSGITIFVDNVVVAISTTNSSTFNFANTGNLTLGIFDGGVQEQMEGTMDEVYIWSRVLSRAEIATLYNCTWNEDYTGNGCSANPCQNGGTCTDTISAYTCSCTSGFIGTNCEVATVLNAPTLVPLDNASNATGRVLTLTFQEAVFAQNASVIDANVTVIDAGTRSNILNVHVSNATAVGISGNVVTLYLSTDLIPGHLYLVTIVKDAIQNANGYGWVGFNDTTAWSFSAAGSDPPSVVDLYPVNNTNPSTANLVHTQAGLILRVVFNEVVKAGSGQIVLTDVSRGMEFEVIYVNSSSVVVFATDGGGSTSGLTTANITLARALTNSTVYQVSVCSACFVDLVGEFVSAGGPSWGFITDGTANVTPTSFSPRNNAVGVTVVGLNKMNITFSERVVRGPSSCSILIRDATTSRLLAALNPQSTSSVVLNKLDTSVELVLPSSALPLPLGAYVFVNMDAHCFRSLSGHNVTALAGYDDWNFVTANATRPTVVRRVPAQSAIDVLTNTTALQLEFSESIRRIATSASDIVLLDVSNGNISSLIMGSNVTIDGPYVNLMLPVLSGQTTYAVIVPDGKFVAFTGETFAGYLVTTDWVFSTAVVQISIAGFLPANGRIDVNATTTTVLVMQFSEPVVGVVGTSVTVYDLSQQTSVAIPATAFSIKGVEATASFKLLGGTYYSILCDAGAFNASGAKDSRVFAGFQSLTVWSFVTTGGAPPVFAPITPPHQGTGVSATLSELVFKFDEVVYVVASGNASIRIVDDSSGGTLHETIAVRNNSVIVDGMRVLVNVTSALTPGSVYHVEIDSRAFVNSVDQFTTGVVDGEWSFTIGGGVVLAAVTFSPARNQTGVNATGFVQLTIEFNASVSAVSGKVITIVDENLGSNTSFSATDSSVVHVTGSSMSINVSLARGHAFHVLIAAGAFSNFAGEYAGIQDTHGWRFVTYGLHDVSLQANGLSPANNSRANNASAIVSLQIVFEEIMHLGSGVIRIVDDSAIGKSISVDVQANADMFSISRNVTTFRWANSSSGLDFGSVYHVIVPRTAFVSPSDTQFIGLALASDWLFATGGGAAPVVIDTVPARNSFAAVVGPSTTTLTIRFDEVVVRGESGMIQVISEKTGVVQQINVVVHSRNVTASGNVLNISLLAPLEEGAAYHVFVDSSVVKNLVGQYFGDFDVALNATRDTWRFVTANAQAPTVTSFEPANGSVSVDPGSLRELRMRFSEFIMQFEQGVRGDVELISVSDGGFPTALRNVSIVDDQATLVLPSSPDAVLPGKWYRVVMKNDSFMSFAGQAFSGLDGLTWSFKTTGGTPLSAVSDPRHLQANVRVDVGVLVLDFGGELVAKSNNALQIELVNESDDMSVLIDTQSRNVAVDTQNGTTLEITVPALLAGKAYHVVVPPGVVTNVGGITSYAGTNVSSWRFFTAGGTNLSAPTNVELTPADNAVDVSENTTLFRMVFSENVQVASVSAAIDLVDESLKRVVLRVYSGSDAVSVLGREVNISVYGLQNSTQYHVDVSSAAFENLAGLAFEGTSSNTWAFQVPGGRRPDIIELQPYDNADVAVAALGSINLTFSETIVLGSTGRVAVYDDSAIGVPLVASIASTLTGNFLFDDSASGLGRRVQVLLPAGAIVEGHAYHIQINGTVFENLVGNVWMGIEGARGWNFVTVGGTTPKLDVLTPRNRSSGHNPGQVLSIAFQENIRALRGGTITIVSNSDMTEVRIQSNDTSLVAVMGPVVYVSVELKPGKQYHVLVSATAFESYVFLQFEGFLNSRSWVFTTSGRSQAVVRALTPGTGTTVDAPLWRNLTLEFDEVVVRATAQQLANVSTPYLYIVKESGVSNSSVIVHRVPWNSSDVDFPAGSPMTVHVHLPNDNNRRLFEPDTKYHVIFDDGFVVNLVGFHAAGVHNVSSWIIRTRARPIVTNSEPGNNQVDVSISGRAGVTLTFNRYMRFADSSMSAVSVSAEGYANIELHDRSQDTFVQVPSNDTSAVVVDGNSIFLNFSRYLGSSGGFTAGTAYYVLIPDALFSDISGTFFAGLQFGDLYFITAGGSSPQYTLVPSAYITEFNTSTTQLRVSFDERVIIEPGTVRVMNLRDVTEYTFDIRTSPAIRLSADARVLTINTSDIAWNVSTTYDVRITPNTIRNFANQFVPEFGRGAWRLITANPFVPRVITLDPHDDDDAVNMDTSRELMIWFSGGVEPGAGFVSVYNDYVHTVIHVDVWNETFVSFHGKKVVVNLTTFGSPLVGGTAYHVVFPDGAFVSPANLSVNGLTLSTAWNFLTSLPGCLPGRECLSGTFYNGSACESCARGKSVSGINKFYCLDCALGRYAANERQGQCELCPLGRFQNASGSSFCYPCSQGFFGHEYGLTQCIDCTPGTFTNVTGESICGLCRVGRYQSMSTQTSCLMCAPGKYQPDQGHEDCKLCARGSFMSDPQATSCNLCTVGKFAANLGQSLCTLCANGTFRGGTGHWNCSDCQAGTYQGNAGQSACVLCERGRYQPLRRQLDCVQCASGHYQMSIGQTECYGCDVGTYTNNDGMSSCLLCATGRYQGQQNQSSCIDCARGKFIDAEGESACMECARGYFAASTTQSICQECAPGKFTNSTGTPECTLCDIGWFTPFSGALLCVEAEYGTSTDTAGNSAVTICPPGTEQGSAGQNACIPCELGFFSDKNKTQTCIGCPGGRYSNVTGMSHCWPCAAGKFALQDKNGTGMTTCIMCEPGFFAPVEVSSRCLHCPPGRYTADVATVQCTVCEVGKFQAKLGRTSCIVCPGAEYVNVTEASSCLECVAGKFLAGIADSALECTDCAPGTFTNVSGHSTCTNCPLGTSSPFNGTTRCIPCDSGRFANVTGLSECHICSPGMVSKLVNVNIGPSTCTSCAAGYHMPYYERSECISCPKGSYIGQQGSSSCTLCGLGKFIGVRGGSVCSDCAEGRFGYRLGLHSCALCAAGKMALRGQSTCVDCPLGRYQGSPGMAYCPVCDQGTIAPLPGRVKCTLCPAGKYQTEAKKSYCIECALGKFRPEGAPGGSCSKCAPGKYADLLGQSSCLECEPGTINTVSGLSTCSDCAVGKYQPIPGNTSCVNCTAGRFALTKGLTECTACAFGLYAPVAGMSVCTVCEVGRYNPSLNQTTCTVCPIGSSNSVTAQVQCVQCTPGRYIGSTEQTSCDQCAVGRFSVRSASGIGAATCSGCSVGKYADMLGLSSCKLCPVGKSMNRTVASVCSDCQPGKFSPYRGAVTCTLCAPGFANSQVAQLSCRMCAAGKAASSNGTVHCSICSAGKYSPPQSDTCNQCPAGTFTDAAGLEVCLVCPQGRFSSIDGSSSCTLCSPGNYQPLARQTACRLCSPGFFASQAGQSECLPCPRGEIAPASAASTCVECNPGKFSANVNSTQCNACPQGRFASFSAQSECKACDSGTYADMVGFTGCLACALGTFSKKNVSNNVEIGPITCTDCLPGKFAENTNSIECKSCGRGRYSAQSRSSRCTDCISGQFAVNAGSSSCQNCSTGTFTGIAGQNQCFVCAGGKFASVSGASQCSTCLKGSVSVSEASTCSLCIPGRFAPSDGQQACLPCSPGKAAFTNGSSACELCPPGRFSLDAASSCLSCDLGTFTANSGSVFCFGCDAGKYANVSGVAECALCSPGEYSLKTSSLCTACPAGKFTDRYGQGTCGGCPVGKHTPADGLSACLDCDPGKFQGGTGASLCADCLPGEFSSTQGLTVCLLCGAGTFSNSLGSSRCLDCAPGFLNANSGASACAPCGLGRFSLARKSTQCTDCDPGTHAPELNSTACTDCLPGKFQRRRSASHCSKCFPGKAQQSPKRGSCDECISGKFSASFGRSLCSSCQFGRFASVANAVKCDKCPPGSIAPSGGSIKCDFCAVGRYAADEESVSCNLCEIGTFQKLTGQSACVKCPRGRAIASLGQSSCTDCGSGKFAGVKGLTSCHECNAGTFSVQNVTRIGTGPVECPPCPRGRFAGSRGQGNCQPCPTGRFNPQNGSSTCIDCPSGRFAASTGHVQCVLCDLGVITNSVGLTVCSDCAAGSFANDTGMSKCLICVAGKFSGARASNCTDCARGKFTNSAGLADCKDCPRGRYAPVLGLDECISCEKGRYQGNTKQTSCLACAPSTFISVEGRAECAPCPAGTFSDVNALVNCKPCAKGTFSKAAAVLCSPCSPGLFADSVASSDCKSCPKGKFAQGNGTVDCDVCVVGKSQNTVESTSCELCALGKSVDTEGRSDCIACVSGRYANKLGLSVCKSCDPGRFSGTLSKICTNCTAGKFASGKGAANCRSCPSGRFAVANGTEICTMCPPGEYIGTEGATACILCPVGRFTDIQGRQSCVECPAGRFANRTGISSCINCPSGAFSLTQAIQCTPCPIGEFSEKDGLSACKDCSVGRFTSKNGTATCVKCPVGKFQDIKKQTMCKDCAIGKFASLTGRSTCIACSAGKVAADPGTALCDTCPKGKFSIAEATSCVLCAVGRFSSVDSQAQCKACPKGKFIARTGSTLCNDCNPGSHNDVEESTSCTLCVPGTVSKDSGQVDCKPCSGGSFAVRSGMSACKNCAIGTFSRSGASVCTNCTVGRYASDPGSPECLVCAGGKFIDKKGQSKCIKCPKGRFQGEPRNATVCDPCSIGKFADVKGLSQCKPCLSGRWANTTETAVCDECAPGTFQNSYGSTACIKCALGQVSGLNGQTQCQRCGSGRFQPQLGQTTCIKCPKGQKGPAEGLSKCVSCAPGKSNGIAGQKKCVNCVPGTFANSTGFINCVPCSKGFRSDDGASVCTGCQPGKFSDILGIVECKVCPVGKFGDKSGQLTCVDCAPGRFQQEISHTSCDVCPPGTFMSVPGASACVMCAAGTFRNSSQESSQCVECPEHNFQPSKGSTDCTRCDYFFFTEGLGSVECKQCDANKYRAVNDSRGSIGSCLNCPQTGVLCQDGVIKALENFYVYIDPQSGVASVTQCPAGLCLGNDRCSANRKPAKENLVCGQCEDGFVPSGTKCVNCKGYNWTVIGAFWAFVWVGVLLMGRLSRPSPSDTAFFGISMYFLQMGSLFLGPLSVFTDWLLFFNLNLSDLINSMAGERAATCIAPVTAYGNMAMKLAGPIMLMFMLLVVMGYTKVWYWKRWQSWNHLRTFLSVCVFVYTPVTNTVLQYLNCVHVGDTMLVSSQPGIECYTPKYFQWAVMVYTSLAVFVCGVPTAFLILLVWASYKNKFYAAKFNHKYGVLYYRYHAKAYYWTVIAVLRRFSLISEFVFVPNRGPKFAVVSFTTVLFLVLHLLVKPYKRPAENNMEMLVHCFLLSLTISLASYSFPYSNWVNMMLSAIVLLPGFGMFAMIAYEKWRARFRPTDDETRDRKLHEKGVARGIMRSDKLYGRPNNKIARRASRKQIMAALGKSRKRRAMRARTMSQSAILRSQSGVDSIEMTSVVSSGVKGTGGDGGGDGSESALALTSSGAQGSSSSSTNLNRSGAKMRGKRSNQSKKESKKMGKKKSKKKSQKTISTSPSKHPLRPTDGSDASESDVEITNSSSSSSSGNAGNRHGEKSSTS